MNQEAEHVTDVWLWLGDHAGTSGREIGTAMQKVTASAGAVGISFEKLGAYIATMSEKTRQAPEVIGTALNAMFGRLQQIKEKGFNEEDETRLNDIAKALGTVDIALMDSEGEWRAVDVILEELAEKWQTLTDKEQAYITTAMGGTRQRNYLLTLLNDLADVTGEGSRALELYNGVMEQTNTTTEKYAMWQESVAAAQGAWTAEVERFYSVLSGNVLKGWYNTLTGILKIINDLTESTGGWNIKIGLAAAAITAIIMIVKGLTISVAGATASIASAGAAAGATSGLFGVLGVAATGAAGGVSLLNVALGATVVGAVVVGLVGLIGLIKKMEDASSQAAESVKRLGNASKSIDEGTTVSAMIDKVEGLASASTYAAEDITEFNKVRQQIIDMWPALESKLGAEVSSVNELQSAYENLTGALHEYQLEQWGELVGASKQT